MKTKTISKSKSKSNSENAVSAFSLAFGLAFIAMLGGCTQKIDSDKPAKISQPGIINKQGGSHGGIVAGQIVVMTQNKVAIQELKKQYQSVQGSEAVGAYLIKDTKIFGNEEAVVNELESTGKFDLVEPNFVVTHNRDIPRDPKWLQLWGLKNYGQDAPNGTEGKRNSDIGVLEAWKTTKGSKEVVVAVLDTGIDYTHPDLKDNIWKNLAEFNGTPNVDDDGNGYVDDFYGWDFISSGRESLDGGQLGDSDPMDDHGHGTHVAGTIGAVANNGIGVAGINWNVSLMALKFLAKAGGGTTFDELYAIEYAIKNKVDIINASFGGGPASKAVKYALEKAGKAGILFVAAAGNDGTDNDETPHYPSNYDLENVLSVAATDNRDQLADFSCYGYESVDIAAPGVAITSTYPVDLAKAEGVEPYQSWAGTSMATPHVVGAAALVLAAMPNLKGQPALLKKRIMDSADWLPELAGKMVTGGRLNVAAAVTGKTGTSPLHAGKWVDQIGFKPVSTARFSGKHIDHAWKFHQPGAKAIKLHISQARIDKPYDVAFIFDGLYRRILEVPELLYDYWTPAIPGDTAYLQFSNSIVAIQKYLGEQKFASDDDIPFGRAVVCWKENGESTCMVFDEPGDPYPNNVSDSIIVDQVKYIAGP